MAEIKLHVQIPRLSPKAMSVARSQAAKHPATSDEHLLAATLLDYEDRIAAFEAELRAEFQRVESQLGLTPKAGE
jgi:hypothetical protein